MATADASPPASFIDPKDVVSRGEDQSTSQDHSSAASTTDPSTASKPSAPQKKKRKSWGQVLPEPTTNLPPRKRAKTAEEKAQRHYERVQRNRQAAHNSRMRKQDEMDRVVAENNRLKQDSQHQTEEIKRLQEEIAYLRNFQGSSTGSRPLTPPVDYTPAFSQNSNTTPAPSLTNGSSNDVSSPPDLSDLATPSSPHALKDSPLDTKQFNDSHSAVDVEFAKYLGDESHFGGHNLNIFGGYDMINNNNNTTANQMLMSTDKVQFDDLLNLDGLDDSNLPAPGANTWGIPATGFEPYSVTDFNLFPTEQYDFSNTCL